MKSILGVLGRDTLSRLMREAVQDAHAENQRAGLVPAEVLAARDAEERGDFERASHLREGKANGATHLKDGN